MKARVVGVCQGGMCRAFAGAEVITGPRGEFQLAPGPNNTVPIGTAARLQIRLADGSEHEAAVMPGPGGTVTVKLPVLGTRMPGFPARPMSWRTNSPVSSSIRTASRSGVSRSMPGPGTAGTRPRLTQGLLPAQEARQGPQSRGAVPQVGLRRRGSS